MTEKVRSTRRMFLSLLGAAAVLGASGAAPAHASIGAGWVTNAKNSVLAIKTYRRWHATKGGQGRAYYLSPGRSTPLNVDTDGFFVPSGKYKTTVVMSPVVGKSYYVYPRAGTWFKVPNGHRATVAVRRK